MKVTLALVLLLLCPFVVAETIEVEYSRFYIHVNKLADDETSDLQFAFGFQHVQKDSLCGIYSANIHTQKKTLPLVVNRHNRFTVPAEKALKLANAKVIIDLAEQANLCDMSVQLETKPEWLKHEYSNQDLRHLQAQYQAFFSNMGSFLSFLMPTVTGLSMQLNHAELTEQANEQIAVVDNKLLLNKDWILSGNNLKLSQRPLRITATTDR